jgi:Pyridoxamine 5'-phosphate oxidase
VERISGKCGPGGRGTKALVGSQKRCHVGPMWIDQNGSEILNRSERHRLLALAASHEGIGRLGVSRASAPLIDPVNFTYDATHGHRVVLRLSEGSLSHTFGGALVALDYVDHEDGVAWSVLVRGLAKPLSGQERETQPPTIPTPLVSSVGMRGTAPVVRVGAHRVEA